VAEAVVGQRLSPISERELNPSLSVGRLRAGASAAPAID
jgi:hypothetical protein